MSEILFARLDELAPFAILSANNTFTGFNTFRGTVIINPTPGTFIQGLNIFQSSPIGGSVAGPVSFNTVTVIDQGVTITGSGSDPYGLLNITQVGLRVNYASAGGDIRGAMVAAYRATASVPGSYYGFSGSVYSNVPNAGLLWGNLGIAQLGPTGSASLIIGLEGEVAVATGATVAQRIGVSSNSQGPVQGTTGLDAAFAISAGGGLNPAAPFKKMFAISKVLYGTAPLDTAADMFWFDAAATIANVFPFSNVTITGNFIDTPTFGINGATGAAIFGGTIGSLDPLLQFRVTGPSKGAVSVVVNTNTTTGSAAVDIINSTGTVELGALANEAARTTVRYGVALGNYAEMTAFSGNGLLVGTFINTSMILGTNNANRVQIFGSGGVGVGTTGDPGSPGIINLLTGLRIGNAATSGNVLRGNGTNFVSAALGVSDLSGLGTNVATALAIAVGSAGALVTNGGNLGTPSAGVGTNLTGTAASLTAGTVTTNANLTGDITSSGNATTFTGKTGGALGQIPGTTAADNANAGNVGQYIESAVPVGSAVPLTNTTAVNVTSIPLTAGDWDISLNGALVLGATTSLSQILVSISTVSNTVDLTEGKFTIQNYAPTVFGAVYQSAGIPKYRLSLSGATTVYFVIRASFTISTASGWGLISARRRR